MKYHWKNQLRDQIINWLPTPQFTGARALCFHDIQDKAAFEKRMIWLKKNFSVVSLKDCFTPPTKKIKVAITFDDGFVSWVTNAAPILEKHHLPATFFTNSGLVGLTGTAMENYFKINCYRTESYLKAISIPQLQSLAQHPLFTIGGHTKDHFLFTKQTNEKTLRTQIIEDKNALEKMTNTKLNYFAYPFGQLIHAAPSVQKIVAEANYNNAFTIVPGPINSQSNPFTIPRDSLELHQSEKTWYKWLHGTYDQLVSQKVKLYQRLNRRYR